MSRNKLYRIVLSFCVAGYLWVGYNYSRVSEFKVNNSNEPGFCMIRSLTGVPCPSCGMTRSVTTMAHGNIDEAIWWNPLGVMMFIAMIIFPVWIITDWIRKKDTFYKFYFQVEKLFQIKPIAITGVIIMTMLWVWNIFKFT